MSSKRVAMHRRRICAMGAGVLLFLSGWLPAATASPPDPPQSTAFANGCPLQRIGTQLIRCDNLTGAGVPAPSWIPELTSRADDQRIPPGSPEPGKDRPPGPTIVQVRGRQFPVDAEQGRYSMLGDLIGRWTIRSARGLPGYLVPEAPWTMVQTGQERFVGCVDRNHSQRCDPGEPSGALGFDYVLWMQYDPDSGWLIEGKCLHPSHRRVGRFRRRSWGADHARRSRRSWRADQQHVQGRDRAERHSERAGGAAERRRARWVSGPGSRLLAQRCQLVLAALGLP